jgi:hypothetical protein
VADQIEILGSAQALSGSDIVEDIAQRVAVALAANCYLRGTDEYQRYSARIVIEVQLVDIDRTSVNEAFTIGQPDGALSGHKSEVDIPEAPAAEVLERAELPLPASLERQVDGLEPANLDDPFSLPPVKAKRYYTPRGSTPRTAE